MHLAIFFDAAAVAGDASLLRRGARAPRRASSPASDAFLARFAAAADQFNEPRQLVDAPDRARDEQPLDLKKLGTFPIVHGVRALALQYGVRCARHGRRACRRWWREQRSTPALARDLVEALHFLMGAEAAHQLRQREQGAGGQQPGAAVGAEHDGARPAARTRWPSSSAFAPACSSTSGSMRSERALTRTTCDAER